MASAAIGSSPTTHEHSLTPTTPSGRRSHTRKPSLRRAQDSHENLHRRKASKASKASVRSGPEAEASQGRDFRVGNIGHNGLIYLRPVKRSSQAPTTPSPSLPTTDTFATNPLSDVSQWRSSLASATSTRHSILSISTPQAPKTSLSTAISHRRTRSASKHELGSSGRTTTPHGTVKVVIDRTNQAPPPPSGKSLDHLAIPHYRLGTPHFTEKGSAILQSSINTGSSQRDPPLPGTSHQIAHGIEVQAQKSKTASPETPATSAHKLSSSTLKRNLHKAQSREDPSESSPAPRNVVKVLNSIPPPSRGHDVRMSPSTGQLLAASVPQLIVQITSPKLLDYDLLSDFFLTYRLFMTAYDLATRLIERLHNAICSSDEFSRIVRVRTFVALRHWILNYFVDDFVANLDLRAKFCLLVNELCHSLQRDAPERVGDLRILAELKKCWRHTCALFWDVPVRPEVENPEEDILPGGILGSRSMSGHWSDDERLANTGSQLELPTEDFPRSDSPHSLLAGPDFAFNQTSKLGSMTISSTSSVSALPHEERQSIQVGSCTIPASIFPGSRHQRDLSFGPRPVPAIGGLQKPPTKPPSAMENPRKHHSRSGSFSDALRDDRAPLPVPKGETENAPPIPITMPGSLIRGATVSPLTPYVETVIPGTPVEEPSSPKFHRQTSDRESDQRGRQFQSSNPGVRRFIGSVRRALSAKNTGPRNSSHSPRRHSPDGEKLANSPFRNPSRREPSAQKRKLVGGRTALRIDLLVAEVSEAFKTAVQEVHEAQEAFQDDSHLPHSAIQPSTQQNMPIPPPTLQIPQPTGKGTSVTTGSRSIVIMDDTNGQITPRPDIQAPKGRFDEAHSQLSSIRPDQGGVQSVPIFLDQNRAESGGLHSEPNEEGSENSFVKLHSDFETDQTLGGQGEIEDAEEMPSDVEADILETPKPRIQGSQDPATDDAGSSSARPSFAAATTTTDDTQTSTNDPFYLDRAPARQLRRLPGGNLRNANHVHSLDEHSHAEYSQAMGQVLHSPKIPPRGSSTNAKELQNESEVTGATQKSLGAPGPTSQPILRPSFEREVAKLAQIPDSEGSENGIESALRKLEGRGNLSMSEPPAEFLASIAGGAEGMGIIGGTSEAVSTGNGIRAKHDHREGEVVELDKTSSAQQDQGLSNHPQVIVKTKPISAAESTTTQSSVPLLERGASYPPKRRTSPPVIVEPASQSSSREKNELDQNSQQTTTVTLPGSEDSYEFIEKDESLRKARAGKRPAMSPQTHQSFLLNDNESLSELSSLTPEDVSDRGGFESPGMHSFFEDEADSGRDTPRQIRHGSFLSPSRSPSRLRRPGNPLAESPVDEFQVDPAYVPGSRPVTREHIMSERQSKPKSAEDLFNAHARQAPLTHSPAATHLPFILAYDSLVLAQQFTVIERDALCEIDWRDLIDLRWNQSATAYYNWVEYLRSNSRPDSRDHQTLLRPGVDMCIARFNLVVRWVKSEVVLTQDISERAATIVKFIHIAQHARRLRNWATMYQVAMALVSADLSRLKQTWATVPEGEKETLRQLEELIMPKRNFHNLRIEIETATSTWAQGGEGGCIPFIGIYTHDLIYNAQKPAKVRASARGGLEDAAEPDADTDEERAVLINFERHHTAATIVKNLLRLIEASSKYTFQPDSEVTSRCLWIGALHDAEVTRRSKELEPFESLSA